MRPKRGIRKRFLVRSAGVWILVLVSGLGCKKSGSEPEPPTVHETVQFWLSDPGQDIQFEKQSAGVGTGRAENVQEITIDPATRYQEMDGFGFALTGGSALHVHAMSAGARHILLSELFETVDTDTVFPPRPRIGVSYLRVSIGSSDLDEYVFSYDDLPAGQTDVNLEHFSLDEDRRHLIPVLKEILQINPDIKIMASPWSPPVWMKTNGSSIGGMLKTEFYDAYARYFVKYIQGMAREGIAIDAITVQNEPLHPGNNPSMLMPATAQAAFIKNSLGPAFQNAGLQTQIVIYDHNADRPDYPLSVLDDPEANPYIDGSAFHLYAGDIGALSTVHDAYPDKHLYFTEQWIGAPGNFAADLRWHIRELVVGASRNWCKTVIEWNLAADENQEPHTPGGCTQCLGALTISGDDLTRNPAYYIIAHASKFVRPGSSRIASSPSIDLPNVAFRSDEETLVVIVLNNGGSDADFNLIAGEKALNSGLPAGAVGTYVWQAAVE